MCSRPVRTAGRGGDDGSHCGAIAVSLRISHTPPTQDVAATASPAHCHNSCSFAGGCDGIVGLELLAELDRHHQVDKRQDKPDDTADCQKSGCCRYTNQHSPQHRGFSCGGGGHERTMAPKPKPASGMQYTPTLHMSIVHDQSTSSRELSAGPMGKGR